MRLLRTLFVGLYLLFAVAPIGWMVVTSLKHREDTTSLTARFVPAPSDARPAADSPRFPVTLEAYSNLVQPGAGSDRSFFYYLANSLVVGIASTIASVLLGTACAYGFSRFRIPGGKDWLFFVLSTRFLPPLAVVVPIVLMYRELDLVDTRLGLAILYTAFNLSLSVWLMKGFIDEIPAAYEEAALVDGYTRMQAFFRVIVPQARAGMAVTAVFCLISAWNEYGFAMTLTSTRA
jgi:multiple sugar transport system permease protein